MRNAKFSTHKKSEKKEILRNQPQWTKVNFVEESIEMETGGFGDAC